VNDLDNGVYPGDEYLPELEDLNGLWTEILDAPVRERIREEYIIIDRWLGPESAAIAGLIGLDKLFNGVNLDGKPSIGFETQP
jgi:hypothetical protein